MPELPKTERVWVTYFDADSNPRFIITSKAARDQYFLYRVDDGGKLTKLGKSASPEDLADTYDVLEVIGKTVAKDD